MDINQSAQSVPMETRSEECRPVESLDVQTANPERDPLDLNLQPVEAKEPPGATPTVQKNERKSIVLNVQNWNSKT